MFFRRIPFVDSVSLGSSIFLDASSFISDVSFNSCDFLDTSASSNSCDFLDTSASSNSCDFLDTSVLSNSCDFLDTSVSSAKFRSPKELSANFSFLSYTDILWESDCFSVKFPYRLFSLA